MHGDDLRMYATRKGWAVTGDSEQHQRLAEIAERTPVSLAMRNGTPIKTSLTSRTECAR